PIGKAEVKRPGDDVTILSYSRSVLTCLKAAEVLAGEDISAEVVDMRTLRPLDLDTVLASVVKTHRVVIVEEDWPYCGIGAGVADRIYNAAFDELDAPIRRVAARDVPVPYARNLEKLVVPSVERVVAAVMDVMYR